ncbi:MAG: OmpA family protein [Bacteroidetes bacterium]|nr:OmpA family protein [Bacteroidota bacterium]
MRFFQVFIIPFVLFNFTPAFIFAQEVINFDAEPENLGTNINSQYSELSPVISPDGKTLFIVRYPPDNTDKNNIWFSVLQNDGTWTLTKDIGSPLNVKGYSTAVNSITPDGNSILLSNIYRYFDGTVSGGGCSMSFRQRGGWSFPKQQNFEKFENLNEYVGYFLANDGKTMLMSIETKWKGHMGERDLYVSFKKGDNEWTKPKNMGQTVNTKEDEDSPVLASDGVTLYFSSSGLPGGYGNTDIWMTKKSDDTWLNWSKPVNLGPKINSDGFDSDFVIPASGEYAYFASAKSGQGKSDIFRIKLPVAAKPNPVVLISGKVLNSKTKEPIMTEIKYEVLSDGSEAGLARSEPVNGEYKIVLPYGKNYGYRAIAQGYYAVSENLDVTELKEYTEIERNLYLVPIEVNEVVRLNNIFFEFGKAVLKPESYPELDRVVKFLNDNPTLTLELSGHTDNVGSDADNLKLSQDRAQSVVNYLVEKSIKQSRLTAKGYGETAPLATNDTDESMALNRRVEFKILKK